MEMYIFACFMLNRERWIEWPRITCPWTDWLSWLEKIHALSTHCCCCVCGCEVFSVVESCCVIQKYVDHHSICVFPDLIPYIKPYSFVNYIIKIVMYLHSQPIKYLFHHGKKILLRRSHFPAKPWFSWVKNTFIYMS